MGLGILGIKPVDDLPEGAPRGREAERILAGEMLQELRLLSKTMTVYAERLASRVVNHVLSVQTFTFDSTGFWFNSFHVPCGSVEVQNLGSHNMTVVSAGPGASAPSTGVGVYVVPAGAIRTVNVASRQVTIYGTSGDQVSAQFLTIGGVLSSGLAGVNGGVA